MAGGSGYASSGPADVKSGTDATHGFPGHGVPPIVMLSQMLSRMLSQMLC